MADTEEKMQELLNICLKEIEKLKIEVYINKIKYIVEQQHMVVKDQLKEPLSSFSYLGNIITEDGRMNLEVSNKMKELIKVYYALN